MRFVPGKTTLWLVATILSGAVALGQGGGARGGGQRGGQQQAGTATGNTAGAAILQRACSGCHGADAIANQHFETAEGYRDIVNTMVDAGAPVTPQELPVLVDYLFATYGKKPASAAPQATSTTDPGKAILDSACTTCHGLDGLANHAYESRAPYESLIGNMIAYGANVTDTQVPVLADYLLKTYGKKPATTAAASTADPGKAILESACTVCHGLDGLTNHNYTSKGPYESLVRSMVAYGAVVTDAQITPLVDYMFKTYGKK
jgi:mono/diheme cytochrome c family protein